MAKRPAPTAAPSIQIRGLEHVQPLIDAGFTMNLDFVPTGAVVHFEKDGVHVVISGGSADVSTNGDITDFSDSLADAVSFALKA